MVDQCFGVAVMRSGGSTMATAEISVVSTLGIHPVDLTVNEYARYLVEGKG